MNTKIFVNLPVKDLNRSVDFFTQVGFSFDPRFTDENATCMIVSDSSFVMLLVEPFFKTFTRREIANATTSAEAILCLSADSRQQVDELVDKAMQAGATQASEPQDPAFMYYRSFQDPDGHQWEIMYMDPSAVQPS